MLDYKKIISALCFFCVFTFSLAANSVCFDPCSSSPCVPCIEECPSYCAFFPIAGDIAVSYDTFRSLPDGSFVDNQGAYTSINAGLPVPFLSTWGFGAQLGGSYGIYDWAGHESNKPIKQSQQQGFITAGIFKKTTECSGFNFGVVYDLMINKNFSVFPVRSNIAQVRFQGSYLFCCSDEVGVWATLNTHNSHRTFEGIPLEFRAISQLNLYWQHFFANHARTKIWAGAPYKKSILFPGRPGRYIIGASFSVPLTDCLSINGHASYMGARNSKGFLKSRRYASNVCFGLAYSFGGSSRSFDCDQIGLRPYLPLADNSIFLTDANNNF